MEERENENYYQDEVKQRPREEEKKKKNITVTLIIFGVLLLLILGIKYCIDHWMPEYQLNKGKKYLEQGEVQKALDMFELARKGMPYNNEPIYYKAVALSKLPMTYENQKALYEIAQLDDCDEASDFAEQTLMNNRKSMESQLGPNYLDNVLFEDRLIRWNNNEPITYSISSDIAVPQNYYEDVRTAFNNWQNATDNQITFQEVQNNNSKINILFTDNITLENSYQPDIAGSTVPVLKDNVLLKMDVKLRDTDKFGNSYGDDQLITLAEHEIGHALGLGAHSAREEDVMFYTGDKIDERTYNKPISERDANTLKLVYNMIPDVIDKPLTKEQSKDMMFHNVLTTYPGENFELEIQRLIAQLRNDRSNIIIWVDLAINYGYKRQYARSNYILKKVLPLTSNDLKNQFVVLYNLAANFYKMRDYKTSEKYLNLATNIDDDLDTQILEAFLDFRLGRLNLAKEKLILLNKTYPDHIEIALKLAEVYYKEQNKAQEKAVIDRLVNNNPRALNDRRVSKYKTVSKTTYVRPVVETK